MKKKFLVIQQKMIGDVLASTVICKGLKEIFPDCQIHFVANENTLAVLENNTDIDKIIQFKSKYSSDKIAFYHFLKSIRKETYTAVIDAYGKIESNLITLFSKAGKKVSHHKWYTSWVYSETVKENLNPDGKTPLALRNRLNLLNSFAKNDEVSIHHPQIFLSQQEIINANKVAEELRTKEGQKLIMIGILGSNELKTYPAEYMAQMLDFIGKKTDARLLLNYIPSQKEAVLNIYEKCRPDTQKKIAIDYYADSLRNFIAILSQCATLIGNEGGAVNMAKALGLPTFCMFSPFIVKGAWHSEETKQHIGIHLKDFKPELFKDQNKKALRQKSHELYHAFEFPLFQNILFKFLEKNALLTKD